jgi:hypothetical protein
MGDTPAALRLLALTLSFAACAIAACDDSSEPDSRGEPATDRPGAACGREIGSHTPMPAEAGKVVSGGYANLLAVGAGRLWIPLADPAAGGPARVDLLAIDTRSGAVRRHRLRASGEVRIRVAAGAVWLADPQTAKVTRLDVESGRRRVVRPYRDGQAPREIAADRDGVWLVPATGGTVLELDPRTARIRNRVQLDAAEIGDVALGARHAWFSTTRGEVIRLDRRSLRPAGEPVEVGATALDIEVAGGEVWVDLGDEDRLAHLDAESGRLVGHAPSGGSVFAIAVGHGSVWATNYGPDTVTRLDARTGERVGDPLETGTDPKGIAVGAGGVWVADAGDCTVTRLAP